MSSFDPQVFAEEVRRVAEDGDLRARMATDMHREYARLNMKTTAEKYERLFKELIT